MNLLTMTRGFSKKFTDTYIQSLKPNKKKDL